MSHNPRLGNWLANVQAEATAKALSGGWIEIRSGEQPADQEIEPADGSLLVRMKLADVAFGKPDNGVLIANKMDRAQAIRSGAPGWVRITSASGDFAADGVVGGEALLNVKQVVEGQFVDLTGFKYVIPKK